MWSTVSWSRILSELTVTTSYRACERAHMTKAPGAAHLHRGHQRVDMLVVQLQDAVQDANFIVPEGLFALPVERQEGPDRQRSVSDGMRRRQWPQSRRT